MNKNPNVEETPPNNLLEDKIPHNVPDNPQDYLEADNEDMSQMTQSYSEISFKSESPENEDYSLNLSVDSLPLEQIMQRPITLPYDRNLQHKQTLNLAGTVHVEGNMTHFVAEDLEHKIKLSSPVSKKEETPSSIKSLKQVDLALLNDLESEAHRMATSIDCLTENLCEILHSISSLTAKNVDVYKDAVAKMSDSMDANIKSMYTMMAKAEEVTQNMKDVQAQAARIKEKIGRAHV